MGEKELKRFSPTRVKREAYVGYGPPGEGQREYPWEVVAEYEDATIHDQGRTHGADGGDEAILRIYIADPDHKDPYDERWFNEESGFFEDVDGDIDLKRVAMEVTEKFNLGHGEEWWVGFVSKDDRERPLGQWSGFGDAEYRKERWRVSIREEET